MLKSGVFVAAVSWLLLACAGAAPSPSPTPVPTPAPTSTPAPTPTPAPCVDRTALVKHAEKVISELSEVTHDLDAFDLDGASSATRIAASETRAMADEVEAANTTAEKHLLRAADAMDQAATSVGDVDLNAATGWLSQGNNEVNLAFEAISDSDYC